MQFDLFDEVQNRILESPSYRMYRDRLSHSNCDRCSLAQSRTQIVVDRGNPESKIMFVGEAPGENEDKQGLAFVGRAGKLLDSLLEEIGIDPDRHALIVNVVKCRPPENRAPKMEEVSACFPFLKKQLELVNPRIIVLLGATALKHILRDRDSLAMEQEVGKWFMSPEYPSVDMMVLYHPAYLLYDPRKTGIMKTHLLALRTHLVSHKIPPLA